MTTAVTGASGHLGGNLVRALLERGEQVRALVREDTRTLEGLDLELVRGDVLDPDSLRLAFDGADVVYHLAACITIGHEQFDTVWNLNSGGPALVADACVDAGVKRLVHFSSIHAFSPFPIDQTIDETRSLSNPDDASLPLYDRSKASGQLAVLAAVERGLDAVVVHPTAVIGPYDFKPSKLGSAILAMMTRTLPALVAGGFDWVDARDVVEGAITAAERGRTGESYLLGGLWRPVAELAQHVEAACGKRAPRIVTPMWLARVGVPFVSAWSKLSGAPPVYTTESLYALRHHRLISCDKATRELGYSCRPLAETIADTCAWFRDAGMA
ncbi:MAG: NAD-dependent epimerase/dehydratase family protein [Deltaproteobacteria bacterium]|nr:NAD-dependent epimerase/dehydratase family protein [Deltaproteobacteria bacterium]